jgi:DNA primase
MIRQSTIDQIFSAARVEEVVGDYVQLKRSGSGLGGLCPFHNEKTPSFKVSPNLGIYKCFGCGRGGNVVDFMMEVEKFTYPEALRHLANRYHIEIEEDNSNKEELTEQVKLRDGLFAALEFGRKYFHNQLQTEEGKLIGLSYFKERGLSEKTIEEFDLGYALEGWKNFTEHAITSGFTHDILLKAGLIKLRNTKTAEDASNEDYYDAYRNRVVFPIHAVSGKVVGFGARQLKKEENSPKYINSPESEVYHKSNILYGLFQARHALREKDDCYLVEGYMDVVMLHQSGIRNVVATSGTALTQEQVKLVRRFTDNCTLLYDGDKAGLKAALRGVDLLLEGGLNVKVVVFPDGEDPDSYCRKLGGQGLDDFITANKKDIILFMTDLLLEEHGKEPDGISKTAHHVVGSLIKIPDPIKRNAYVNKASEVLNVDESLLFAEMRRQAGIAKRTGPRKESPKPEDQGNLLLPRVDKDPIKVREEGTRELLLLKSLIRYCDQAMNDDIDVAGFVFAELQSEEYQFENAFAGRIIVEAADHYKKMNSLKMDFFVQHREAAPLAAEVAARTYDLSPQWKEKWEISVTPEEENYKDEITANINYLKLYKVDEVIYKSEAKIKEAEKKEEYEELYAAQKRHAKLLQLRLEIAAYLGNIILK